jgi:hypothetical protein
MPKNEDFAKNRKKFFAEKSHFLKKLIFKILKKLAKKS